MENKAYRILIETDGRTPEASHQMKSLGKGAMVGLTEQPKRCNTREANLIPGSKFRSESPAIRETEAQQEAKPRIRRRRHGRTWRRQRGTSGRRGDAPRRGETSESH